jgi:hypothetical protein
VPRECPCGARLSGKAKRIGGNELCGPCVARHYRGQPQLRKHAAPAAVAARPAAAAAARSPEPPAPFVLLPEVPSGHATRHACSAPSAHRAEAAESLAVLSAADAARGDGGAASQCRRSVCLCWHLCGGSRKHLQPALLHPTLWLMGLLYSSGAAQPCDTSLLSPPLAQCRCSDNTASHKLRCHSKNVRGRGSSSTSVRLLSTTSQAQQSPGE